MDFDEINDLQYNHGMVLWKAWVERHGSDDGFNLWYYKDNGPYDRIRQTLKEFEELT